MYILLYCRLSYFRTDLMKHLNASSNLDIYSLDDLLPKRFIWIIKLIVPSPVITNVLELIDIIKTASIKYIFSKEAIKTFYISVLRR